MKKDKSFLGRGWSFPPTFHKHSLGTVEMVSQEEDIKQSLEILLSTAKGERIMMPDYGCDLQSFLFSSISSSNVHLIQESIKSAILKYETRINVNDVLVDFNKYLEGEIKIEVDYTIETSNTRFNLVFPYYQVEGTDIPHLYHKQINQTQIVESYD